MIKKKTMEVKVIFPEGNDLFKALKKPLKSIVLLLSFSSNVLCILCKRNPFVKYNSVEEA